MFPKSEKKFTIKTAINEQQSNSLTQYPSIALVILNNQFIDNDITDAAI